MEISDTVMRDAAIVFLVGLVLLVLLRRLFAKNKNPLVLVLGGSGAGKTTLFYQLRDGSSHQGTVPSMEQNSDTIRLSQKEGKVRVLDVVDVPGHPRVRGEAEEYYSRASKLVFVVDAVDFMAQKSGLSEHLFEVVSHPVVQKRRVPLLIVCNKMDQGAKAHTVEFIRKRLEKEIEAVRSTRATLGEAALQGSSIAKPGETFTFAGLKSPIASFCSSAVLTGEIAEIKSFLS